MNPALARLKARYVVEALNELGYRFYNVGSTDIFLGKGELSELMGRSRFQWISSNLKLADGGYFTRRHAVIDREGMRAGFFGLLSPDAPQTEVSGRKEFSIQDPAEAAREMVTELKAQGCRLIIALASLGPEAEKNLASSVEGIDAVLGGFSSSLTEKPETTGAALVFRAGSKGTHFGILSLTVSDEGAGAWADGDVSGALDRGSGRRYSWKLHPLDQTIPDDRGMTALLDRYKAALKEQKISEQGRPAEIPVVLEPQPGSSRPTYVGAAACAKCHQEIFSEWLTSIHAQAVAVLELKNQDYNPECLACHATGYRRPGGFVSPSLSPHLKGVQCEACHGQGSLHDGKGNIDFAPGEGDCRSCHDGENSPSFRFKDYIERLGGHAAKPAGGAGR